MVNAENKPTQERRIAGSNPVIGSILINVLFMAQHKWDSKVGTNQWDNAASCIKCGCVKETIKGDVTYYIDDTLYHYAPECDERYVDVDENDIPDQPS